MSYSYVSWWFPFENCVFVLIMELCRIWEELWAAFQCGKLRLQTLRRAPTAAASLSARFFPKLPCPSLCLFNLIDNKPNFFGVLWKSLYLCTIIIYRVWNLLRCILLCSAQQQMSISNASVKRKGSAKEVKVGKRSSEMKVGERAAVPRVIFLRPSHSSTTASYLYRLYWLLPSAFIRLSMMSNS